MDKFIKDKINDLEVKDNFNSISNNIDYLNYIKEKKSFDISRLIKRLIIPLGTLVSVLVLVLCIIFTNINDEYLVYSAKEKKALNSFNITKDEISSFIDKLDSFSANLTIEVFNNKISVNKLDLTSNKNYCISPISVYMGLAMALECSDGTTREEILNAVGVTYEEVERFTGYLYSILNEEKYIKDDILQNKKLMYYEQLANSIWIDKNLPLKPEGLERLSEIFHCSSYHVPFKGNSLSASKAISDYIKEMTKGLIKPNINFDPETLFVLINTYYIKDVWNEEGDDLSFTNETYEFIEYDKDIVNIKLLTGYYKEGVVYETDSYRHFYTETYNGNKIKFIVPKNGYSLEDIYTYETLKEVNNVEYQIFNHEEKLWYNTRCLFPEYETEFDEDLKDVLVDSFGINKLFKNAELNNILDNSVISKYDRIYCKEVRHMTKLKVDKSGIEGAAVTILPMPGKGAVGEDYKKVYYDFIVDRDFIFIMTNNQNVTLFSGVVTEI